MGYISIKLGKLYIYSIWIQTQNQLYTWYIERSTDTLQHTNYKSASTNTAKKSDGKHKGPQDP